MMGRGINSEGHFEGWWARLDSEPAPNLMPGDANLNGVVNHQDLARVQSNMGREGFWYQGDLNQDGREGEEDRDILRAAAVPEVSQLGWLIRGAAALLRHRERTRKRS